VQPTGTESANLKIPKVITSSLLWHRLRGKGHSAVLARGAIGAFVVEVIGAGLLLGLHVLLARLLGVAQYGIYVYAITWINIIAILCLLGFQTSLVRFVAEYKANQQWDLLNGILKRSSRIVLIFSLAVAATGAMIILAIKHRISIDQLLTYSLALVLLPLFALAWLREASLRALKHVVQSELLLRVIRPIILGAIVGAFFLIMAGPLRSYHVMAANLLTVAIVFAAGTFLLFRALPESSRQGQPTYAQRQWLSVSLPLLLVAGMRIILKRTDIVMLGMLRGSQDAGVYSAASRVSDLVVFGLMAVNSILAPMISELYHTGKIQELQRIIRRAARGIFAFTVTASILLAVCGKFVLSLFGTEFIIAFVPLLILLLGQTVNGLCGSVGLIMGMAGHQNEMGLIVTISAALNIIFNILLIPLFGLVGAALSTACAMALWNIAMLAYVQRRLGLNPTVLQKD